MSSSIDDPGTESIGDLETAVAALCASIDPADPPLETTERALAVGTDYLGVEHGIVTTVTPETNHWEVIASTDPGTGRFAVSRTVDLRRTFCRHTLADVDGDGNDPRDGDGSRLALHDVDAQGYGDDVARETHGLGCYAGRTVHLDGEQYGTVCFADDDPRAEQFSDAERRFIDLVAQEITNELDRYRYERLFSHGGGLLDVFSRVLRHNLRNDMTVVRGYCNEIADDAGASSAAARAATDRIDDLIALSEKVRELEAVVRNDFQVSQISLVGVLERVVANVESEYPDATIVLEAPADASLVAMATIETALRELLENAAKHAGPDPTCTVTVAPATEYVEIVVDDDGPGLTAQERRVFDSEDETPLVHGSGLGLWMVAWIVRSHDGTVTVDADADGTRLSVTLPRPLVDGQLADQRSRM
jgi:signal transduction histidine kinase